MEIINITEACVSKIKQIIADDGMGEQKLRIFVQGGGCSGLQYGFTFEETAGEDDTVVTVDGVDFLIDVMSYQYLVGANLDYVESFEGANFLITNPNATATCGCGSSFSA